MELVYEQIGKTVPLEVEIPYPIWLKECSIEFTASATPGDRTLAFLTAPSTKAMLRFINAMKKYHNEFAQKWEDHTALDDEVIPTEVADAEDMAGLAALLADLIAKHDTSMDNLDNSQFTVSGSYVDICGYQSGGPPIDTGEQMNSLWKCMRRCCNILDCEPNAHLDAPHHKFNYFRHGWAHDFLSKVPYQLPSGQAYVTQHVITANQKKLLLFQVGATSATTDRGWIINMSSPLIVPHDCSVFIVDANDVDSAGDRVHAVGIGTRVDYTGLGYIPVAF